MSLSDPSKPSVTNRPHPRPRAIGAVNWIGLWTLTSKETVRFVKVYAQTIVAPVITTVLFYLVFVIALHGVGRAGGSESYMTFLIPGLVMMSMAQNAFANTSSSIVISKVQGNIVDVLMPPLSALELTVGYMLGGIARGLMVGLVSIGALSLIIDIPVVDFGYVAFHGFIGVMMLSLLGLVGGIWSEKFDHLAAVQNFIVMPATFLSGTFYAAQQLPEGWRFVCHMNPFFYMIDGFRYGFIGINDMPLEIGVVVMAVSNLVLLALAYGMIRSGYKLKS